MKGVSRFDKIFDHLLPAILEVNPSTDSIEEAVSDITSIKYLGEFMAGQMAMDAMLFIPGEWSDMKTYAPTGPGSLRGIKRLKQAKLTNKIERDEYNSYISELATKLNIRALDVEHALCEWDKYERLLWKQGSTRKYKKTWTLTELF